ncbi:MAG: hypothetical protein ACLQFM_14665 [Terriglobales bacterium]|jgi:hypothetical protein
MIKSVRQRFGRRNRLLVRVLAVMVIYEACVIKIPRANASGPAEEALIVKIPFNAQKHGANDEVERLYKLEGELIQALEHSHVGEYDGNEIGEGTFTMYAYGPSANKLLEVALPVLMKHNLPTGSYAVKRYGKPGAKQERIPLSTGAPN